MEQRDVTRWASCVTARVCGLCLGRGSCFPVCLPGPPVSAVETGTRTERSRFSGGWHRLIKCKVRNNNFLQRGGLAGNDPAAGAEI